MSIRESLSSLVLIVSFLRKSKNKIYYKLYIFWQIISFFLSSNHYKIKSFFHWFSFFFLKEIISQHLTVITLATDYQLVTDTFWLFLVLFHPKTPLFWLPLRLWYISGNLCLLHNYNTIHNLSILWLNNTNDFLHVSRMILFSSGRLSSCR